VSRSTVNDITGAFTRQLHSMPSRAILAGERRRARFHVLLLLPPSLLLLFLLLYRNIRFLSIQMTSPCSRTFARGITASRRCRLSEAQGKLRCSRLYSANVYLDPEDTRAQEQRRRWSTREMRLDNDSRRVRNALACAAPTITTTPSTSKRAKSTRRDNVEREASLF